MVSLRGLEERKMELKMEIISEIMMQSVTYKMTGCPFIRQYNR